MHMQLVKIYSITYLCTCSPSDSDVTSLDLRERDLVLAATNGLFDNMDDDEITRYLGQLKVRKIIVHSYGLDYYSSEYSGAPLIRTLLGPSQYGRIIEVSRLQRCRSLPNCSLPSTAHAQYDVI